MAGANLPPTWSQLFPYLLHSTFLWLAILVFTVIRSELFRYFRSPAFRKIVRRARDNGTKGPVLTFARAIRNIIVTLEHRRLAEADTAIYFGYPRCVCGIIVCVFYMINTYAQSVPFYFSVFQCAYGVFVALNLIVRFVYTERLIAFTFKLTTIVDCLSIPTLIFCFSDRWLNFNFLQAYSVLVEWSLLEKHDFVLQNRPALMRLCYNLFIQLLCFLFITSCGVQFFELLGELPFQALRLETYQITWANSVYFAVVTFMTVGYGDFSPYTFLGRMWVVFHIIFAAVLLSRGISQLIEALQSMRRGSGSYVNTPGSKHVVVTGRIRWEFLRQFVSEFLEETTNRGTRLIVLASNPDWTEDKWNQFVDEKPTFNHHLIYLEGSALHVDDLHRAHIPSARAVFVLADPHHEDPYKEDSDILKSVLTIRNYCGTVPVYTLNILNDSSFQFGIALEHVSDYELLAQNAYASVLPSSALLGCPVDQFQSQDRNNPLLSTELGHVIDEAATAPEDEDVSDPRTNTNNHNNHSNNISSNSNSNNNNNNNNSNGHGSSVRSALPLLSVDWFSSDLGREDKRGKTAQGRTSRNATNRKSVSLCMQELETLLLSESIFCNGLSTLITNATLRADPQPKTMDRPWLMEYKLGAECSVQQFDIRKEMEGRTVTDVATVLLDYGLVLLAVRQEIDIDWTLATTEVVLRESMTAMCLSYHDQFVIDRIVDHAAVFIAQSQRNQDLEQEREREQRERQRERVGERVAQFSEPQVQQAQAPVRSSAFQPTPSQRPSNPQQQPSPPQPQPQNRPPQPQPPNIGESLPPMSHSSTAMSKLSRSRLTPARVPSNHTVQPQQEDSSERDNLMSGEVAVAGPSSVTGSRSRSILTTNRSLLRTSASVSRGLTAARAARAVGSGSGTTGSGGRSRKKPQQRIYSAKDRLPTALRGHVIICVDGETSLMNLDVLVRRIWQPRKVQKRRVPIVVINPRFPKNFARKLGGDQKGLFPLQGNSLSLATLKQAHYKSARAFIIMASETREDSDRQSSTDSKVIFTVMALDSLLAGGNTFVCCVLDAEASLQLLRAPREARRVGGIFNNDGTVHPVTGDSNLALDIAQQRSGLMDGYRATSFNTLRRTQSRLESMRSLSRYGALGLGSTGTGGLTTSIGGGSRLRTSRSRSTRAGSRVGGLRQRGMTRSGSLRNASGLLDDDEDVLDHRGLDGDGEDLEDEDEYGVLTGIGGTRLRETEVSAEKRIREERYERQRYASGEMIISSLFTSLLAREYSDPGYIQLVRQLIGADMEECRSSGGGYIRSDTRGNYGRQDNRGSYIRHVAIPDSWTSVEKAIGGRTYRELSVKLLEFGCIALGLYRSGDAPVRQELYSDFWSRRVDEVVYQTDNDGDVGAGGAGGGHFGPQQQGYGGRGGVDGGRNNHTGTFETGGGGGGSGEAYGYGGYDDGYGYEYGYEYDTGSMAEYAPQTYNNDNNNNNGRGNGDGNNDGASRWLLAEGPGDHQNQQQQQLSTSESVPLLSSADEFDRMSYTCPSTKRRIFYHELVNGENVLPYVYSCPEPYTAVVCTDVVFVLCNPKTVIPDEWDDEF